jgi:hypothetical protein
MHARRPAALVLFAINVACTEARAPKANGREVMPACPAGPFATEVATLLPSLAPITKVALLPVKTLDRSIEPGCIVPFRKEPDDRLIDVGRVVGTTMMRGGRGKPTVIGRGRLEIGRRALHLRLANDAGDATLTIDLDGSHVKLAEKGQAPFEADVLLEGDEPLPLPVDALVAALDRCDDDARLGRTEDGNVIEARRGALALWRSRWIDREASAAVDTSFACAPSDARFVWRTASGDTLPMIALGSARSQRVLVIARQGGSNTEDITDPGYDGVR